MTSHVNFSYISSHKNVYYWTDSMTVLHWIRGTPKRHPPFIANRPGKIRDATVPNQWRYCPSKSNTADVGSRGIPVTGYMANRSGFPSPARKRMAT